MTSLITVAAATNGMPEMKGLRLKRLLKFLTVKDRGLTHGEALCLWLADFLFRFAPIREDQVYFILEEYQTYIIAFGMQLFMLDPKVKKIPVATLALYDRTRVSFSGRKDFLDLQSGDQLADVIRAPLEAISYNLTTLYQRGIRRVEQASKNDKEDSARENG